jgi:cysteine synthase
VEGVELKVYTPHIRKVELDKLAEALGAEIIILPRGEKAGEAEDQEGGHGGRRGRRRSSQE